MERSAPALLRPALSLLAILTLLTGVLYPLGVTGLARALFPVRAGGSLVKAGGRVVGSELIGQPFDDPRYIAGRPSATAGFPGNALASSGSNLGPLNPALHDAVRARLDALRALEPGREDPYPIDLLTASASGLDPHISPAAALRQAARVARARGMEIGEVLAAIEEHVEPRALGFLGEPRVNVLLLNLALDARSPRPEAPR